MDKEAEQPVQAGRAKRWEECPIEEKINRLRIVLRDIESGLSQLYRDIERVQSQFANHEHGVLGTPLVPATRHGHLHGAIEGSRRSLLD